MKCDTYSNCYSRKIYVCNPLGIKDCTFREKSAYGNTHCYYFRVLEKDGLCENKKAQEDK